MLERLLRVCQDKGFARFKSKERVYLGIGYRSRSSSQATSVCETEERGGEFADARGKRKLSSVRISCDIETVFVAGCPRSVMSCIGTNSSTTRRDGRPSGEESQLLVYYRAAVDGGDCDIGRERGKRSD